MPIAMSAMDETVYAQGGAPGLYYENGQMYEQDTRNPVDAGLKGWTGAGTVLTLDHFNYSTDQPITLQVAPGTTIVLKGVNSIKSTNEDKQVKSTAAVQCIGKLTIKGSGALTASAGSGSSSAGISASSILIEEGTIIIQGNASTKSATGIRAGSMQVNGGNITAIGLTDDQAGGIGIRTDAQYIQNGGTVIAKGSEESFCTKGLYVGSLCLYYHKNGSYIGRAIPFSVKGSSHLGKADQYNSKTGTYAFAEDVKIGPDREHISFIPCVKVKSLGIDRVKVSWNRAQEPVDGYLVWRAASRNGNYKMIATTGQNTWTDTKLRKNRTYYYKVRAYKQTANSKYSFVYGSDSLPVSASTRLKVPAFKLKAKKNKVTIKWKQVAGATGYKIYRANTKKGKYKVIKSVRKNKKYVNKKLKRNKNYYYKMRAYKKMNGKICYSRYSKPKLIKTK